jgi:hypothetical protein
MSVSRGQTLLIAAVGLSIAAFMWRESGRERAPRAAAGVPEPSIRKELAELRAAVGLLAASRTAEHRVERYATGAFPADATDGGASVADDEKIAEQATAPHEVTSAQSRQKSFRRAELLGALLAEEHRDPAWAATVSSEVRKVLATMDQSKFPSARIVSEECGSTMCRLRIETSNEYEKVRFSDVLGRIPFRLFAVGDEGDGAGWTLFVARPGTKLARAE